MDFININLDITGSEIKLIIFELFCIGLIIWILASAERRKSIFEAMTGTNKVFEYDELNMSTFLMLVVFYTMSVIFGVIGLGDSAILFFIVLVVGSLGSEAISVAKDILKIYFGKKWPAKRNENQ